MIFIKSLLTALFLSPVVLQSNEKPIRCEVVTSLGHITLEVYPAQAPKTTANFLRYVEAGLYDGTHFFRVCTPENEANRTIPIEVIQGGDVAETKQFDPVKIETTAQTGLRHLDGTLSMARGEPHTATSSFFICIGDQPELDQGGKRNPDSYGFAAFGKVIAGMEVVRKIQSQKETNQYLDEPVIIIQITRID